MPKASHQANRFSQTAIQDSINAIGWQLMSEVKDSLLIQASFDESGKLNDSEIVAFGGCVGTSVQLNALTPKWQDLLKPHGISSTSMKDAIHFHGSYVGWKKKTGDRDTLLRALATLIIDSDLMVVATPMTSAEFKVLPESHKKKLGGDLQYCGFEACVSTVLHMMPGAALHIVCDLSEEYAEKCVKLFNKIRSRDNLAKASCYALTFADDARLPCLQAADMIAYCSRAEHLQATKTPEPIVQDLITILRTSDRKYGSLIYKATGEGLGHGEIKGVV